MTATGHWKIVVKTPMGEQKMEVELNEDGAALSGTMHNEQHPAAPILEPKISDGRLGWKYPVKKPMSTTLVFDVQVEGDAMTGTCKAGIFPAAPLTGVRQA